MKTYLADLAILLEGCWGRLAAAFAFFAASAALDVVCLSVLPVFVLAALSPERGLAQYAPAFVAGLSPAALVGGVLALFVVRAGFMLLVGARMSGLAEWIRARVVRRLLEDVLAAPFESVTRRAMSDEITMVYNYAHNFSTGVVVSLLRLALDALTAVVVLAYVATVEPVVVLATGLVFLAVGLAYLAGVRGMTARSSRRVADLQSEFSHEATRALNSAREVRVYGLQRYFLAVITENLRATRAAQAVLGAIYWFPRALGELTLILLAIGYMAFKSGVGADTVLVMSNLSVLAFAGLRLLPAFAQGMSNLSYLQSGRRVTRVLADRLRARSTPAPRPASSGPAGRFESLELRNVSFRYEGAPHDALRGASLTLRRGQSAGVIGPSGAGKSTLADVLLGLLVPSRGEVLVNGRPAALDSPEWRRLTGFVPQSPYIANDTLLRNIAYGIPDAEIDLELARQVLRQAQLEDVAAGLPKGLDTLLGDHGVRLSGGQRQRVAIARALYRRRDFLVLDEATSALDAETEREVIAAIEALKGTVTTFIVAHRVSTLRHCDFIVEMREGGVVDVRSPPLAA